MEPADWDIYRGNRSSTRNSARRKPPRGCGPGKQCELQDVTVRAWKCLRRQGNLNALPARGRQRIPQESKTDEDGKGRGQAAMPTSEQAVQYGVLLRPGRTETAGVKPVKGLTNPCTALALTGG